MQQEWATNEDRERFARGDSELHTHCEMILRLERSELQWLGGLPVEGVERLNGRVPSFLCFRDDIVNGVWLALGNLQSVPISRYMIRETYSDESSKEPEGEYKEDDWEGIPLDV